MVSLRTTVLHQADACSPDDRSRRSAVVWGSHYRPDEFDIHLAADGATVSVWGTLRDRIGPVVTFGESLNVLSGFPLELGSLPADYDPSWSRDNT